MLLLFFCLVLCEIEHYFLIFYLWLQVLNCHESVIYILAPLRYATIYGCSDTTIVLGAVGKVITSNNCIMLVAAVC